MAGRGSQLAIAWFTAAEQTGQCIRVVFSDDGGQTFGVPVQIDEGAAEGRVSLAMLADQSVVLAWLSQSGREFELRVQRVYSDGTLGSTLGVDRLPAGRKSGFPRMTSNGDRAILAWTSIDDDSTQVRAVELRGR